MITLLTPRHASSSRRKIVTLLAQAHTDIAELRGYAHHLRHHPDSGATSRFSPRQLDSLITALRQGHNLLVQRLRELRPAPDLTASGMEVPAEESIARTSAFLIVTYKRCGRRLGLALHEAREGRDLASGEILYQLLRDFEKQLWLMNIPSKRPILGFSAIPLFQAP